MKNINDFDDSSSQNNLKNENNQELSNIIKWKNIKDAKVLCKHCGRTANNGIRCLGICVADNEY